MYGQSTYGPASEKTEEEMGVRERLMRVDEDDYIKDPYAKQQATLMKH